MYVGNLSPERAAERAGDSFSCPTALLTPTELSGPLAGESNSAEGPPHAPPQCRAGFGVTNEVAFATAV